MDTFFVVVVFKGEGWEKQLIHQYYQYMQQSGKYENANVALRNSETRSGGGCSFLKLGKQNQYIITDNVVVEATKTLHVYDDLQGCVVSDISKLKMLKKLLKIVPARVWTPGSVADVTGLTQGVQS